MTAVARIAFTDPLPIRNPIEEYIARRNVDQLEKLVLDGQYAFVRTAVFPPAARNLHVRLQRLVVSKTQLSTMFQQNRIIAIHRAIVDDDEFNIKTLMDADRLSVSKLAGSLRTPLHTAVLYERLTLANYITLHHPQTVDQTDAVSRAHIRIRPETQH